MSGYTDDNCVCPVCKENTLKVNNESSPFEQVNSTCIKCGFCSITCIHRMSLEEVISENKDYIMDNEDREITDEEIKDITSKYLSFKKEDFDL